MNRAGLPPLINCRTLVELLRRRADQQPQRQAFGFLADGETESERITYSELDRQARTIGAILQQRRAAGGRVLLLYPAGLNFIAAFWGCLYAGAVAVPAQLPRLKHESLSRLEAVASDARAQFALTTQETLIGLSPRLSQSPILQSLHWLSTDQATNFSANDWQEPALPADTLAFLQYTSGSTGAPKGVMLSHGNLLHNLELIRRLFRVEVDDRGVFWLPLYHDMGLIGGLLETLYAGASALLMSPLTFVERPLRWLQAMSRFKATISGAPNFAYDFCVERIPPAERAALDLSQWRTAFCGAEPVWAKTLDRFAEAFAPCGFRRAAFYPTYGLAEATLIVSGGKQAGHPAMCTLSSTALQTNRVFEVQSGDADGRTLVSCGRTDPGERIVIVDPETGAPCAPDQIGEIWVSGASVAQGYWQRPAETERVFRAQLTGEGPFLRSGDLGFLREGELFIAGRLKDLIIIRGRNYHPPDIELIAERSHAALQPNGGAAFSVEVDNQERLVVVFELNRHHRAVNIEEVATAIRAAIARACGIETYMVVLIKPGHLPRTTSGKVQRYRCRAQFSEGALPSIGISLRGQSGQG